MDKYQRVNASALALLLLFLCYQTVGVSAIHGTVSAIHGTGRYPMTDPEMRKKKTLCVENIDNGLWGWDCKSSAIAKENCALRCVSAACYGKIYGEDPLEEGEIDFKRGQEFRYCVRRESIGESINGKTYID